MRYRDYLRSRLRGIVSSEVTLPTGFHLVGHVALVHLDFEAMKYASVIGEKTLEYDHRILSVAVRTGPTEGVTRLPSYELVAGNGNTITTHIENGVKYQLDPLRLTFSGGNRRERMRLSRIVNDGEKVIDMFSCVGQFALQIAMSANVEVTAIEINQEAYRIIMGYLHDTIEYLPFALEALVEVGGAIHMHMNVPDSGLEDVRMSIRKMCKDHGYSSIVSAHHVKNYSPGIEHYVFDITVTSEA
ncbi:MAG: class I SAM-dependent methyltransferase [Candidatus Thorarchaeota archaeon SMTZ1-45]